jgi:hypothetical protein
LEAGGAVGSPTFYGSRGAGDLTGIITLVDAAPQRLAGIQQTFTPGQSLGFKLTSTTNLNGPDLFGLIYQDTFNFAINDSSGQPVPTLGFDVVGADVFASLYLDSQDPNVNTFASDSSISPAAGGPPIVIDEVTAVEETGSPVPESSALSTATCGLLAIGCLSFEARSKPGENLRGLVRLENLRHEKSQLGSTLRRSKRKPQGAIPAN